MTPIDGMLHIPWIKQDILVSRESFFLGIAFGFLLSMALYKEG